MNSFESALSTTPIGQGMLCQDVLRHDTGVGMGITDFAVDFFLIG